MHNGTRHAAAVTFSVEQHNRQTRGLPVIKVIRGQKQQDYR